MIGGPAWFATAALLVTAGLGVLAPDLASGTRLVAATVLGALLGASPVRFREPGPPWRATLLGAATLPVAVWGLGAAWRALGGGGAPGGALVLLPFLALLLLLVLVDRGAPVRLVRLVGVEAFKTRRGTLLRVGLLAAAGLTLVAGWVHERPPDASGWSVLATTLGTGFATAEVFVLVLGATALAGEASAGTLKMILPHAYRRSDWVVAKGTVLVLAALAFTVVIVGVGAAHAAATEGLGDVTQTIEPLFPGDEAVVEVFAPAGRMLGYFAARVALGFAALVATGMLGLFCSAVLDSVTAALCLAFLLFAGVQFADLFLGLPRHAVESLYPWYPAEVGLLLEKLGRALNERWDEALLPVGLAVAAATAALLLLFALRAFARRDVHA